MAETDKKTTNLTIETSAEDKLVLDLLSSKDMIINRDSVYEICSSLNSKVNSLDLDTSTVLTAFKPLVEADILNNYIKGLSEAVNSLTTNIITITDILMASSDSHVECENGANSQKTIVEEPKIIKTKVIIEESPSKKAIKEISNQDSLGISTIIYKLLKNKNETLDNLLKNEDYLEEIKELITNSHLVSKDLKKTIKKLDDAVFIDNMKKMKKNKMIISIEGVDFLKKYYNKVSEQNNTTIIKLFEEVKNKELVYNKLFYVNRAIEFINKEAKNNNFSNKMLNTYNGGNNKLDEGTTYAFRMVIDTLSEMKKVSAEDFLKLCKASDYKEVKKVSSISSNFINSETDSIQELLKNILGGE